jgi:hypothetical protein
MEKRDLKKEYAEFYTMKKNELRMVDVPEFSYLMIDGRGNPNTSLEYQQAVEALYGLSYAIKFKIKKGGTDIDYGVMPLEGQWWTENMADFSTDRKEDWLWTMAILQPSFVDGSLVEVCRREVEEKKDLPALEKIRFAPFRDGRSAQILHLGPYADEAPTIEKLHEFIEDQGLARSGKHREIYLNDPRRTAGDKLKTIIRQPVR